MHTSMYLSPPQHTHVGAHCRLHGKHLDLGGSSTASADLGNEVSSTVAISTRSPSHLIERYQRMSMHPHAEGKLRYARTGLPRTVDFVGKGRGEFS